jgi:hypothetical protein
VIRRLARLAQLAIVVAGCASASPHQVAPHPARWRGDFETGNLLQWSYLLNPRGLTIVTRDPERVPNPPATGLAGQSPAATHAIVDAPVAQGRHAARVEITERDLWPNGLNRVEVEYKPPRATVAEGQRSCFSWRFFLPAVLSEARHQIGYWESYPTYKQIMSFEVRGQTIAFVTRLPSERVHWTAPGAVTANVWHQLATCAVWSTDPARGAFDVWFDGRQVVAHASARTLWDNSNAPPSPNFVQIGILRDVPAAPEVMFLDDATEDADFAGAP